MKNKLLIVGFIATTGLLGGCSSNVELGDKVEALTNQVGDLSIKVDELSAAQKMTASDTEAAAAIAQSAASEAERANARIDNIVESYKK